MIEKRFNIEIDPELETTTDGATSGPPIKKSVYLSGVRNVLAWILESQAGSDLAASLRYHAKTILLVPFSGSLTRK